MLGSVLKQDVCYVLYNLYVFLILFWVASLAVGKGSAWSKAGRRDDIGAGILQTTGLNVAGKQCLRQHRPASRGGMSEATRISHCETSIGESFFITLSDWRPPRGEGVWGW